MSEFVPHGPLQPADLSACAQEPIHIPGAVEPHGVLLVIHGADLRVIQISENSSDHLGEEPASFLNRKLRDILPESSFRQLESGILGLSRDGDPARILDLSVVGRQGIFDATLHRLHGLIYLELEPRATSDGLQAPSLSYGAMANALTELRGAASLADLCGRTAAHVRRLTGFDRVMVYRFLEDDSGEVIAEARRDDLTPYLGLRYPASDIPAQARQLYIRNPIRLKPAVGIAGARLVPGLNPVTGAPLDMSFCILRRMSPIHEEYLRNMGVVASMSLSILKDQRLWGLIACHHGTPRYVTPSTRIGCEFLTEFLSSQIAAKEDSDLRDYRTRIASDGKSLEESLRRTGSIAGLCAERSSEILSVVNAGGSAVFSESQLLLTGQTPAREQIQSLLEWLTGNQKEPVFFTDKLQNAYLPAAEFTGTGSGILSIRTTKRGRDFLLWFRPGVSTTIDWAGNPEKPVEMKKDENARIGPRQSFELWKQTVAGQSAPWLAVERQYASSLRNVIAEVRLTRQNEEVTRLNSELSRSNIELEAFAYAASHDLQEPIRTIRSYAQLMLRGAAPEPNTPTPDLLKAIVGAADRMTDLVRGLLDYARIGGLERIQCVSMNLNETLAAVVGNLGNAIDEQHAAITHDPLPRVYGDPARIRLVFQNLISNALRYHSSEPPRVHVRADSLNGECVVHVRDNGIGFNPRYAERIFEVFQRLHGREVSGSGVGLAICRKVVEQHGGKIWAQSVEGEGSVFSFTLPRG